MRSRARARGKGRVSRRGNGAGVAVVCVAKLEAPVEKVAEPRGLQTVADAIDRVASKLIDGDQHDQTGVARLSRDGLGRGRQRAESDQEEG